MNFVYGHGFSWLWRPPTSGHETANRVSVCITGWCEPDLQPRNGACACWVILCIMDKPPSTVRVQILSWNHGMTEFESYSGSSCWRNVGRWVGVASNNGFHCHIALEWFQRKGNMFVFCGGCYCCLTAGFLRAFSVPTENVGTATPKMTGLISPAERSLRNWYLTGYI